MGLSIEGVADLVDVKKSHLAYLSQCQGIQLVEAIGLAMSGSLSSKQIVDSWGTRIKYPEGDPKKARYDDTDELTKLLANLSSRLDAV